MRAHAITIGPFLKDNLSELPPQKAPRVGDGGLGGARKWSARERPGLGRGRPKEEARPEQFIRNGVVWGRTVCWGRVSSRGLRICLMFLVLVCLSVLSLPLPVGPVSALPVGPVSAFARRSYFRHCPFPSPLHPSSAPAILFRCITRHGLGYTGDCEPGRVTRVV